MKIFLYSNRGADSVATAQKVKAIAESCGAGCVDKYDESVDFIIIVGGDGAFLHTLADYDYPSVPVLGVNTGHLGFFQELQPDQLDKLPGILSESKYAVQPARLVEASVKTAEGETHFSAINDIALRDQDSRTVHLRLEIGENLIESFSGDGVIISSPAGSTAYNYSLGGSIVDPRLELLQLTPMAPMNNSIYRCFTSSVLLPADMKIKVVPHNVRTRNLMLLVDGEKFCIPEASELSVGLSKREIHIVRLPDYDFWSKVKSKFL